MPLSAGCAGSASTRSGVGPGRWFAWLSCLFATGCGGQGAEATVASTDYVSAPVVLGSREDHLEQRSRGRVLLRELGCVNCHASEDPIPARRGPSLQELGNRVSAAWLRSWLEDPLAIDPGTCMPDVLAGRSDRADIVEDLVAFLLADSSVESFARPAEDELPMPTENLQAWGEELYHSIGCVACHPVLADGRQEEGRASGGSVAAGADAGDSVGLHHVAAKYGHQALVSFLLDPSQVRPSGRMPDMHLDPREAHALSAFLRSRSAAAGAASLASPRAVDGGRAAAGERWYRQLGCANCHDVPAPDSQGGGLAASLVGPVLASLDPERGCLSATAGEWPRYALSPAQQQDLRVTLASAEAQAADSRSLLDEHLASHACRRCHRLDDRGGVAPAVATYFSTSDPTLGQEAWSPPVLDGVADKLQDDWLEAAIAHGQQERFYMRTRMPGFGASAAARIAGALHSVGSETEGDSLLPLPGDKDQRREMLDLGRELVGTDGMNCISCHRFAGEQAGVMGALDLVHTTKSRLRPEWFRRFLHDPFRFNPGTLMPRFFDNGVSVRPNLGGGDAERQIAAMWHYLSQGRNVRKPKGLRPPPMELEVAEEAVILRRSIQDGGKRAIGVGLPGSVNFAFDAEGLVLDQVWWGRFLDASPVWSGQGSGAARVLSRRRARLQGLGIARLESVDSPWPEGSRRDRGDRWLGYDLDERRRPVFRYVVDGVEVLDHAQEQLVADREGLPMLQRELRLRSASAGQLVLMVAAADRVEYRGGGVYAVGADLEVVAEEQVCRIVRDGDRVQLRMALDHGTEEQTCRIGYRWIGGVR